MEEISCLVSENQLEIDLNELIESSVGLSVAVERCPLCSEAKRPFYCQRCVNEGQFIHSYATYPDSYSAKHNKWDQSKTTRDHFLERFKSETASLQRRIDKRNAIDECRRNIELLKQSIEASRKLTLQNKASHDNIRRENLVHYSKGKKHQEKKKRIKEYIERVSETIHRKKEKLAQKCNELMALRKSHIADLTTFIFPVIEVKSERTSQEMATSDDVLQELQDASQTAYVHGRWINASGQYRIVAPTLPAHGEYSQYKIMAEDGATAAGLSSPQSAGNTIIAGLCYTSQSVAVIAHILNVCLPKKQCYSEFCYCNLSEKQFNKAVARLNQNILYLCFSQGLDPERIEPKHTLHNILELLTHTQLGRIGPFEVEQDMMDSVEDSNGHSEESDEDMYSLQTDPDTGDWEQVP
ncbi:beclin 1-associated autophagy-related key regulator-like isoform X2 [Dreissena polymorpha]|uniref:beclin 1-associated autophagy-related key regulator-like isoform X2 n=1 Tax=Dreissena polymorpha TaxID=45954 RepID=UPI00226422C4|nr:beclin 1-associated autophagy-related key regulator-like isoform X2 [Dreissena polymorpha]